jgi:hypothetical protein
MPASQSFNIRHSKLAVFWCCVGAQTCVFSSSAKLASVFPLVIVKKQTIQTESHVPSALLRCVQSAIARLSDFRAFYVGYRTPICSIENTAPASREQLPAKRRFRQVQFADRSWADELAQNETLPAVSRSESWIRLLEISPSVERGPRRAYLQLTLVQYLKVRVDS